MGVKTTTTYTCDKCGVVTAQPLTMYVQGTALTSPPDSIVLCSPCYTKLIPIPPFPPPL